MKNLAHLALACVAAATLSACNTGTDTGATNVERSQDKEGPAATKDGNAAGDSATSGLRRAPDRKVTGREQFENADQTIDRDHDGLAD